jgi:hypothetical protein
LCDEIGNARAIIEKVNNSDCCWVYLHIANEQWKCALSNTAATKNKNATGYEG